MNYTFEMLGMCVGYNANGGYQFDQEGCMRRQWPPSESLEWVENWHWGHSYKICCVCLALMWSSRWYLLYAMKIQSGRGQEYGNGIPCPEWKCRRSSSEVKKQRPHFRKWHLNWSFKPVPCILLWWLRSEPWRMVRYEHPLALHVRTFPSTPCLDALCSMNWTLLLVLKLQATYLHL